MNCFTFVFKILLRSINNFEFSRKNDDEQIQFRILIMMHIILIIIQFCIF
uniref:Uncharacterized protein n=1 Tax=Solanum lycopersicum TaxID=4081 RepID=A0A3Q7GDV6_SOLLC